MRLRPKSLILSLRSRKGRALPHSGAAKPPDSELQLSYSHFSPEAATKIRLAQAFEVCEAGNDS